MNIAGKTILITGGASEIGLEAAKQFLDLGVRVIVTGRKQLETDFWGTVKLTNALLPYFRKQRFWENNHIKFYHGINQISRRCLLRCFQACP